MKRIYISAVALLALASMPLASQKVTRVHRSAAAPEIADLDSAPGRSYLGVGVSDLNNDRIQALKLKDDRGVEVVQVDQDAPAGKAGLKEHDVILTFNGTPVESQEQFKRLMRETPAGRTVSLDIIREGQQQNVKVQLADRKKLESTVWPHEPKAFAFAMPPMPPMPAMPDFPRALTERTITRVRSNSGATLESLSPQLGDYFGVKNGEGMLVRSVQKGSAAEAAGLRAGDVVVKVGDQKITDNSDWREALRSNKNGKVSVVIVRDKKEQTLSMSVPPRKGPDSSAVYRESPDVEMAFENAAARLAGLEPYLEAIEPLLEDGVELGLDSARKSLIENQSEIDKAVKKGLEQLHREMIRNQKFLQGNVSASIKLAAAQSKAHSAEIENAVHQAEHAIENIRTGLGSEMQ